MHLSRERIIVVASVALLIGAGLAVAATKRERSDAIYPPQRIPLLFSHEQHLKADVECDACHENATKSLRATDRLLPGARPGKPHEECDSCHDIEKAAEGKVVDPKSACEDCHRGFDKTVQKEPAKASFPTPNLIFNHKVHRERKIDCVVCHNSSTSNTMDDVGLATRYQLPKMEICLTCHDGKTAAAACSTCHLTEGGRIQQTFTSGTLRPMQGDPFGLDHGPRFEFNHGTRARLDRAICMECHTEGSCAQCHDSLQKPLSVHPNDYITLHPVQARMDTTRCEACHRFQSFCASCHERAGVGLDSAPQLRSRNLRVHPNYLEWVDVFGPNHHAIAASRDIKSCMACHREESCMACHATSASVPGSRATNPHPDGFKGLCASLAGKNDRACLKCHTLPDLQTKGCK